MKRITFLMILLVLFSFAFGTNLKGSGNLPVTWNKAAEETLRTGIAPSDHYKTHEMGQLYMTLCNWGVFGSQRGDATTSRCDPFHAYYEICDLSDGACIPSGEYPGCSGVEYLFQGCLWIGAYVDGDTLVSIGEDGWFQVREFYSSKYLNDTMKTRTVYDDEFLAGDSSWAKSEQDFICTFTDTAQDRNFVHEGHRPIGLKVTQRSMSWSYDYAKNIVAIDYAIENIRDDHRPLSNVYIGVYVDGDCGHIDTPDYAQDDVNGFIEEYTPAWDTVAYPINLAWLADNDGDPNGDRRFDERSCPGAMAVKVLYPTDSIRPDLQYSFNWWISNTNEDYDWGPCMNENFTGWDGTPEDDKMKYEVLSNGEFDYNQSDIMDYADPGSGWISVPEQADDLMDGYDTRFLLSFGPFNLEFGEVETLTIGFMIGENFHINPTNYCGPRGSVGSCGSEWSDEVYSYANLADAAIMLQDIYNNDWKGPQPPPAPIVDVVLDPYDITIYWREEPAESLIQDPITNLFDFEGYRIYMADWNLENYYTPLKEYDKVDFRRFEKFTYDDVTGVMTPRLSNDVFDVDEEYVAPINNVDGSWLRDSVVTLTMPIFQNDSMPPQKLHKAPGDEDSLMYYYYHLRDVRPGQERYVVVTAFDNGRNIPYLASLESNKKNNALWIVPRGDNDEIEGVYAWPNPYRVDQTYYGQDGLWAEGSPTSTWTEYSRKMHFANLPEKCTIRIFTLDGDVVDILEHDDNEPGSVIGGETWSMINQNDQSIVSGMYVFSVEDHDTGDIETGKFVIIK